MKEIKITDSENEKGLIYACKAISALVAEFCGRTENFKAGGRSVLLISCPDKYYDLFKCEIEDKIADVIAVMYKYEFFKRKIVAGGLNKVEREILLSALIGADIEDDKRYIVRRLRTFNDFAVDGIYNFRLQPLKNKWKDVASYVPCFFTVGELNDFVSYLVSERRTKKVIVESGKVYDGNYNRLRRTFLTGSLEECAIVREVILSSSGNVEVFSAIPELDEKYLKTFFGRRLSFLQRKKFN